MMRQLQARKSIRESFRLPLSEEHARLLITEAYKADVESRGGTFHADNHTAGNIAQLAKYLTEDNNKSCVILLGTCGNGKTTLMRALRTVIGLRDIQNELEKAFPNGERIINRQLKIVDATQVAAYAKDPDAFRVLQDVLLLAIDDFGKEPTEVMSYGNVTSPIVELLETRYNEQKFTLISTNLGAQEIRPKYGARIADRLNEISARIIFEQDSYRGK